MQDKSGYRLEVIGFRQFEVKMLIDIIDFHTTTEDKCLVI